MNVKQGDLAIVIDSDDIADIGIICRVGSYIGDRSKDFGREIHHWTRLWNVESVSRPFSFPDGDTQGAEMGDDCLRAISGLPDAESTDEQVVKSAANLVSAD